MEGVIESISKGRRVGVNRAAESELESESESPESWVFGKAGVGVGVY